MSNKLCELKNSLSVPGVRKKIASITVFLFFFIMMLFVSISVQADADTIHFSISQQRADISLTDYALITGRKLLFPYDLVKEYRTNEVIGDYAAEQALELLLKGTGLHVSTTDQGNLIINLDRVSGENKAMKKNGFMAALIAALLTPTGDVHAQGAILEEIIVTAQRKEQLAQDVPIAISTLTSSRIERAGILDTESLDVLVPGLSFTRQFQGGNPYLRGVGNAVVTAGAEGSVAMYVDDVYVAIPAGNVFSFNNIEQVEVLKGPQGTLFGRNATGGVIHVRTPLPSHEREMHVSAGIGNYGTTRANFYGTTGVTDDLAVNIAFAGKNQNEGWGENAVTSEDIHLGWNYGVRFGALWTPSDATSIRLQADYSRERSDAGLNSTVIPGTIAQFGGTFVGAYNSLNTPKEVADNKQGGVSLKINHDLDWAEIVSITAWRKSELDFHIDQERSVPNIILATVGQPHETVSQEFHLLSNNDSGLRWMLGAYFFHMTGEQDPLLVSGLSQLPNAATRILAEQEVESISVFGDVTYEVIEDTSLTFGLRYTVDDFDVNYSFARLSFAGAVTDITPFVPCANCSQPGMQSDSFNKLTYRAVLDHHFTSDIMAYASYSRGFKSGGYNILNPNTPPVEPEVLDAYEIGVKSTLLDGRLRANAGAFFYDYSDIQVLQIVTGGAISLNAAGADIMGVEADFELLVTDRLSFSGGFQVLDTEFTEFNNGPSYLPNPAVCNPVTATGSGGTVLPGPLTGGNLRCPTDLAGNEIPFSPDFTGNISASYLYPTNHGDFSLTGTYYYSSGSFAAPSNRVEQGSHTLVNLNLEWTAPSDTWYVQLWGRNIFDEYYYALPTVSNFGDFNVPPEPVTYGVTVGFRM